MNIVEIAAHAKIDPKDILMASLEHERDIAYKKIKAAKSPFELDKANAMMRYIIWRIESEEVIDYDY